MKDLWFIYKIVRCSKTAPNWVILFLLSLLLSGQDFNKEIFFIQKRKKCFSFEKYMFIINFFSSKRIIIEQQQLMMILTFEPKYRL